MKEKTPQEQTAAARQVELLTNALNGASSDGYWLNVTGKFPPKIYPQGAEVSPFNRLILALNTDSNGYSTPLYTTFSDSRKRGTSVMAEERSVPLNWYRWDSYVNKHDEKDILPREDYLKLPLEQQSLYKGVRKREIRSLFSIEQTTFPHVEPGTFEKLRQQYGGITDRGNILAEERQTRSQVTRFREQISQNLVPVRKSTTGKAFYDSNKDAIYIPDQKHFSDYKDYVQELVRKAVCATGHRERLAREGMVMTGGKAPSEDALRYERLVSELASGIKLMEFGLPARLSPENQPLIEAWTQEFKENPCLIDAVESDVNNALDVIRRAEQGERMEYAYARNRQQTEELRGQSEERPQVSATEALVLQDILRKGGMEINVRNFPGGENEKNAFMAKFNGLDYYEGQLLSALDNAQNRLEDPELVNVAYTQASNEAAHIHGICSEMLPKEREQKGAYHIADEISSVPDKRNKEFVVVIDKSSGIVDVILPVAVRSGGDVVMPNGDKRPYWLTPDEVMTADERKEAGARTVAFSSPGFNKDKITSALMAQGASYVRFYNKMGLLEYRPDDTYFPNKEVYSAKLSGKDLTIVSRFDISDAVKRATEVQFDRIQMLRDDNGAWALYLKPQNEESFSIYPEKNDVNRFFATMKQSDHVASGAVRNELAQKYYALAQAQPELKTDLFGQFPEGIDPLRIKRVNVFRTKDDRILCVPVIDGMDKIQPREVTKQQWQRMWVAEDVARYKTALAATLFSDLLQQNLSEKSVERQHSEETAIVRPDTASDFPDLQHYEKLKAIHPDCILLFRVGDNYEAYQADVLPTSELLGLEKVRVSSADNSRHAERISFSHEKLDTYLPKLVRAGMRIAICDLPESVEQQQKSNTEKRPEIGKTEETEQHTGLRM